MAEKKALLIIAENAELSAATPNIAKLLKKAALITSYTAGTILDGAVAAENITTTDAANVVSVIEQEKSLVVLDLGKASSAELETALGLCLEAVDRKTIVSVVAKGAVAFYGMGVNAKAGEISRKAAAQDILTTLAFVADLQLTENCVGAIVYQALKSPNLKLEEIGKLKEALTRMEGALARDNREPWDKHDCA